MKSLRHQRLLINAKKPDTLMTVEQINEARSFGSKAFNKKKTKRKMARDSRRINRAS